MQHEKPGPHAGLGMVKIEYHPVPEKMVGFIIGRLGTRITRVEAESGCKVLIAPNRGELPVRPCFLIGSPHSISLCKQLIQQIIDLGNLPHMDGMDTGRGPEGNSVVEMSIPSSKVGFVIGKGGETIRQLQERANVKMVIVEDCSTLGAIEKPLLIFGEPSKCQRAKEMVLKLLEEADMQGPGGGGMGTFNNFDGMHGGRDGPNGIVMGGPDFPSQFGGGREFNVRGGGGGGGFGVGRGGGPGRGCEQFDQYGQPDQRHQQYGAPQGWNAYGNQYKKQSIGPASVSPAINPQTGQPDYSAAWAEDYRQANMIMQASILLQANMILQQVSGGRCWPPPSGSGP